MWTWGLLLNFRSQQIWFNFSFQSQAKLWVRVSKTRDQHYSYKDIYSTAIFLKDWSQRANRRSLCYSENLDYVRPNMSCCLSVMPFPVSTTSPPLCTQSCVWNICLHYFSCLFLPSCFKSLSPLALARFCSCTHGHTPRSSHSPLVAAPSTWKPFSDFLFLIRDSTETQSRD